jgi:hypothetical protein
MPARSAATVNVFMMRSRHKSWDRSAWVEDAVPPCFLYSFLLFRIGPCGCNELQDHMQDPRAARMCYASTTPPILLYDVNEYQSRIVLLSTNLTEAKTLLLHRVFELAISMQGAGVKRCAFCARRAGGPGEHNNRRFAVCTVNDRGVNIAINRSKNHAASTNALPQLPCCSSVLYIDIGAPG